jgi:hypothetical protein
MYIFCILYSVFCILPGFTVEQNELIFVIIRAKAKSGVS